MGKKVNIDDISLDILYSYMQSGSDVHVPEEILYYLELLEKIYSMMQRIDKFGSRDMIVKHLVISEKAKGKEISRYKALQLYYDAMEYFYADSKVSKAVHRNMLADKLEKLLNVALVTYESASDLKGISSLVKEISILRQLNKEDVIDENPLDNKPFVLYSINPEDVGIDGVDQKELIEYVEGLPELNAIVRDKILRDANVKTPKLIMNEQENPYKTE